jgi:selenocysteine lyase/cysteine desulfurase
MIHQAGGICFVDFACSAPYIDINMHPADPEAYLDAIYFSPHKFLGGPSSSGILIFNQKLYNNTVPDNPGGGTVDYTNPWGEHKYHDEIEAREDGGTPPFLQTIRVAMAMDLKEEMGTNNILQRDYQLLSKAWSRMSTIPNLSILAKEQKERLGIISFYIDDLHYNLAVQLLNDRYGIQVRGGCSCAGTYGHYLFELSYERSKELIEQFNIGKFDNKPGWIRLSLHPTMTDTELEFVLTAIEAICTNHAEWAKDYQYNKKTNEWDYIGK